MLKDQWTGTPCFIVLQLAISPQQSGTEPVLVQNDTHLTLKVEGVILNGEKPGLFRQIHSISIKVTSSIVSRQQTTSDQKVSDRSGSNQVHYVL